MIESKSDPSLLRFKYSIGEHACGTHLYLPTIMTDDGGVRSNYSWIWGFPLISPSLDIAITVSAEKIEGVSLG